jgi:hypothetical protein
MNIAMLACVFGMLLPGVGFPQSTVSQTSGESALYPTLNGMLERIDTSRSIVVIDDMKYSYSLLTLKVHKEDVRAEFNDLKAGQAIRFSFDLAAPGSKSGATRSVKQIWIEKK